VTTERLVWALSEIAAGALALFVLATLPLGILIGKALARWQGRREAAGEYVAEPVVPILDTPPDGTPMPPSPPLYRVPELPTATYRLDRHGVYRRTDEGPGAFPESFTEAEFEAARRWRQAFDRLAVEVARDLITDPAQATGVTRVDLPPREDQPR